MPWTGRSKASQGPHQQKFLSPYFFPVPCTEIRGVPLHVNGLKTADSAALDQVVEYGDFRPLNVHLHHHAGLGPRWFLWKCAPQKPAEVKSRDPPALRFLDGMNAVVVRRVERSANGGFSISGAVEKAVSRGSPGCPWNDLGGTAPMREPVPGDLLKRGMAGRIGLNQDVPPMSRAEKPGEKQGSLPEVGAAIDENLFPGGVPQTEGIPPGQSARPHALPLDRQKAGNVRARGTPVRRFHRQASRFIFQATMKERNRGRIKGRRASR